MSDQFHTIPLVFLNEAAVTKNGTTTGAWFNKPRGMAFNLWYYCTSAGAPSVTLYFDYSIWPKGGTTIVSRVPQTTTPSLFAPEYASRTNYRTITLASGVITLDAWTHIDTPAEMKYPFVACRIRAVEADVAAVTTLTVAMGTEGT